MHFYPVLELMSDSLTAIYVGPRDSNWATSMPFASCPLHVSLFSFQAMCGVNLFSCLLTSVSLLQQGAFFDSLVFMSQFPSFTFDCVILSFCSAFGQVFIYHTIKVFGKSSVTTFNEFTKCFHEFSVTTNLRIYEFKCSVSQVQQHLTNSPHVFTNFLQLRIYEFFAKLSLFI